MSNPEEKNHVHCKCMDNTCPNNHYSNCKICKDYPKELPEWDREATNEELKDQIRTMFLLIRQLNVKSEAEIEAVCIPNLSLYVYEKISQALTNERERLEDTNIEIEKEIAGLAGIIVSQIQDTGKNHLAQMKLERILSLIRNPLK